MATRFTLGWEPQLAPPILTTGAKNQSAGNLTVVGIIWKHAEKRNGVVLRVDKGDFAPFLSALETVTGLKTTNTDAKDR